MRKLVLITILILLAIGVPGASGSSAGSATPGNGGGPFILGSKTYSASIPMELRLVYVNGKEVTHYYAAVIVWGSGDRLSGTYTFSYTVHIWGPIYHTFDIITVDKYEKVWHEIEVYLY